VVSVTLGNPVSSRATMGRSNHRSRRFGENVIVTEPDPGARTRGAPSEVSANPATDALTPLLETHTRNLTETTVRGPRGVTGRPRARGEATIRLDRA